MQPLTKRDDAHKVAIQLFRDRGQVQADAQQSESVVVGGVAGVASLLLQDEELPMVSGRCPLLLVGVSLRTNSAWPVWEGGVTVGQLAMVISGGCCLLLLCSQGPWWGWWSVGDG
eukprot:3709997-Rhodomonas_salina.1